MATTPEQRIMQLENDNKVLWEQLSLLANTALKLEDTLGRFMAKGAGPDVVCRIFSDDYRQQLETLTETSTAPTKDPVESFQVSEDPKPQLTQEQFEAILNDPSCLKGYSFDPRDPQLMADKIHLMGQQIDLIQNTICKVITKTGFSRIVPLQAHFRGLEEGYRDSKEVADRQQGYHHTS